MTEITAGYSFLSRTLQYNTKHLYIIIAVTNSNEAIFVNVTTKKGNKDDTCILNVSDHDFITHTSVINYGDTTKAPIGKIEEAISKDYFNPQTPVSGELLKRILKGALNSPNLPQKYLKHIPPEIS